MNRLLRFYSNPLINSLKKISNDEGIHSKIRNIGVIAHVDAGKTTTTERMLFYSNFIHSIGNVDDGNTVMDFMDQERERGITINSAAITFSWKQHQFNLIDTPGHVDFNIEVERSLRVLDGAISILDASAGVEAQTLTVWRQANKYQIPRIIYINKMDKPNANFKSCLSSIENKLNTKPFPIQIPIYENKNFIGLVDLINMRKLTWNNKNSIADFGKTFEISSLTKIDSVYEESLRNRTNLIENLAQLNEEFAEILLEKYMLDYSSMNDHLLLDTYLRKACLNCSMTPVLLGSAFRNIGVQPLMDAIIKYLPNPNDLMKNSYAKYYEKNLMGLCFKITHDHQKSRKKLDSNTSIASLSTNASSILNKNKIDDANDDILTYVRVYNGELSSKTKVYNVNQQVREFCDKIYIPFANQIKQVSKVTSGNIALVSGLTKTQTGDTIVITKQAYEAAKEILSKENDTIRKLMSIDLDVPPPVYFCTVEPAAESEEKRLNFALECLQREDPSLRVIINSEENFGQTVIQGMGELHLEIIKDRILKEYKLKAYFGPLNIAYKESPTKTVEENFHLEKSLNEKKNSIQISLKVIPNKNYKFKSVEIMINKNEQINPEEIPIEVVNAINHGIRSALNKGVLLRNPVVDTEIHLTKFIANKGVQIPYISSAAYQCILNGLNQAECMIIQPVMKVEITTTKAYSPKVYSDLSRRNASNMKVTDSNMTDINISARVPLAKLAAYSSDLRRLTSGNTTFTIQFDSYEQLSQREYQELLEKKKF